MRFLQWNPPPYIFFYSLIWRVHKFQINSISYGPLVRVSSASLSCTHFSFLSYLIHFIFFIIIFFFDVRSALWMGVCIHYVAGCDNKTTKRKPKKYIYYKNKKDMERVLLSCNDAQPGDNNSTSKKEYWRSSFSFVYFFPSSLVFHGMFQLVYFVLPHLSRVPFYFLRNIRGHSWTDILNK